MIVQLVHLITSNYLFIDILKYRISFYIAITTEKIAITDFFATMILVSPLKVAGNFFYPFLKKKIFNF